jgi:hypothetical protein
VFAGRVFMFRIVLRIDKGTNTNKCNKNKNSFSTSQKTARVRYKDR